MAAMRAANASTLYCPRVSWVAMICRFRLVRQTLSSSIRSSAPDAAARQRFNRIAADAADAEHRDPRMVQALHRLGAKLGLRACKLVNHRPCLPPVFSLCIVAWGPFLCQETAGGRTTLSALRPLAVAFYLFSLIFFVCRGPPPRLRRKTARAAALTSNTPHATASANRIASILRPLIPFRPFPRQTRGHTAAGNPRPAAPPPWRRRRHISVLRSAGTAFPETNEGCAGRCRDSNAP